MKTVKSHVTRALPSGARIPTCDNSGAKLIKLFAVKGMKTVKGRYPAAGVGDLIQEPDMKKQVVFAVIVRQKKEYMRADGTRIKFEDNAAVVLKDEKGNPKGTIFKGPIAKEVTERWPAIAKVASIIV